MATVDIREEPRTSCTGGRYGAESVAFDAPGPAGTVTTHDVTLALPVSLLCTRLDAKKKNDGDEIGFDVNPDTPLGLSPTASVSGGDKTVSVPASMCALLDAETLWKGQSLILEEGGTRNDLGAIVSWDTEAGTVTTHAGASDDFTTAAAIKITTSMSPCIISTGWVEITSGDSKVYTFGDNKIGASFVPAGSTIRIRYRSNGGAARVVVVMEYLY